MFAESLEERIVIVKEQSDNDNITARILDALVNAIDFEVDNYDEIPFGWYECWGNDYAVYPFEAYIDGGLYCYRLTQTDIKTLEDGTTGETVRLLPYEQVF